MTNESIVKVLIAIGDSESLRYIDLDLIDPVLGKIASSVSLTAEDVFLSHGIQACSMYMEICNEYDENQVQEDLLRYLAKRNTFLSEIDAPEGAPENKPNRGITQGYHNGE